MSSPAATSQHLCLPDALKQQGFELRQIAGLTSGETIILTAGSYDFGTDRTGNVGFSLEIGDDSSITIVPGSSGIHLDSKLVFEKQKLGNEIINVGSARFQVGSARPTARNRRELIAGSTPQIHEQTIRVLEAEQALDAGTALANERPRLRSSNVGPSSNSITGFLARRAAASTEPLHSQREATARSAMPAQSLPGVSTNPTGFVDRLLAARSDLGEQRRSQHPNPEELARRAKHGKALTWHRDTDHWHFGLVGLATADLPWQPHFDDPTHLTDYQSDLARSVGTLPSVPVIADLGAGPVGIVGSRAARLACARHLMTALATLSSPNDLQISVRATEDCHEDWTWAAQLPHVTSSIDLARALVVIDDERQFENSASGLTVAASAGVGTILLADDVASLPPRCATVMVLHESGLATIRNHRDGSTVTNATPHGISTRLASETASNLAYQDIGLSLLSAAS